MELTVNQFIEKLELLGRTLTNRETNLALARKAKEIIYRRVKSGYGVNNDKSDAENTERSSLLALSKSYIDYRKGLVIFRRSSQGHIYPIENKGRGKNRTIRAPKLGEFGRPSKSNLTLTGQMLNAIIVLADDNSFELHIAPTSRRNPDGKSDKMNNQELAEMVSKNGRPFFALTSGEIRIITRELETIIQKRIQEILG